jgi:hypothetical protein
MDTQCRCGTEFRFSFINRLHRAVLCRATLVPLEWPLLLALCRGLVELPWAAALAPARYTANATPDLS